MHVLIVWLFEHLILILLFACIKSVCELEGLAISFAAECFPFLPGNEILKNINPKSTVFCKHKLENYFEVCKVWVSSIGLVLSIGI